MKRSTLVLSAILISVPAFAGAADDFKQGYDESFERSFRASFRKGLVDSCSQYNPVSFCECCADGALSQLTVAQMQDRAFTQDYVKTKIIPACQEKTAKP